MNRKGFLLLDSLINVVIVSALCSLCLMTYQNVSHYDEGYDDYQKEMADYYEEVYSSLKVCEKCVIEEDTSALEA